MNIRFNQPSSKHEDTVEALFLALLVSGIDGVNAIDANSNETAEVSVSVRHDTYGVRREVVFAGISDEDAKELLLFLARRLSEQSCREGTDTAVS